MHRIKRKMFALLMCALMLLQFGCGMSKEEYIKSGFPVERLAIVVHGVSSGDENVFFSYFRSAINGKANFPLAAEKDNRNNATHILRITVKNVEEEFAGFRHSFDQYGSGRSTVMHYYSYKIKLDLIRAYDSQKIWGWSPDEWTTYTNYKKSIKWLANASASEMKKKGLLTPDLY